MVIYPNYCICCNHEFIILHSVGKGICLEFSEIKRNLLAAEVRWKLLIHLPRAHVKGYAQSFE